MNFSTKIATLRKNKGLTQADLGEKLNVSAQAVSKWENGASQPDIECLRKMSALFGVSLDELLNNEATATSPIDQNTQASTANNDKITCFSCHKPISNNEFSVIHDNTPGSTMPNKIYCPDCYARIMREQKIANQAYEKQAREKERKKKELEQAMNIEKATHCFTKGLWRGLILSLIVLTIALIGYLTEPRTEFLLLLIFLPISTFTLTAQCFWGNFITDFFDFFRRSFTTPFRFIFEFSLDGIIWLITVKLICWIFFGALSIMFFLLGLALSLMLSLVVFPFTLPHAIRRARAGDVDAFDTL